MSDHTADMPDVRQQIDALLDSYYEGRMTIVIPVDDNVADELMAIVSDAVAASNKALLERVQGYSRTECDYCEVHNRVNAELERLADKETT